MQTILWIAGVYLLICVAAYFGNRLFMYFPDPARVAPAEAGLEGVEEVALKAKDGTTLIAWYAKAEPGKPTVLYFHGNAANAANRAPKIKTIREDGTGVFYLNNRGYGGSEGRPTEANNVADAMRAYDHVVSERGVRPENVVAFGESLGSGQAIRLAAQRDIRAVVLEAPLTSTVDIARRTYFWLPVGLLLTDTYHNEKNIAAVDAPVLVMHGERDGVIPLAHGRRVFEAAGEPKRFETFPGANHADLFDHGAWETARAFIAQAATR